MARKFRKRDILVVGVVVLVVWAVLLWHTTSAPGSNAAQIVATPINPQSNVIIAIKQPNEAGAVAAKGVEAGSETWSPISPFSEGSAIDEWYRWGRGKLESIQSTHWLLRNYVFLGLVALFGFPILMQYYITCCLGSLSMFNPLLRKAKEGFDKVTGRSTFQERIEQQAASVDVRGAGRTEDRH